MLAAMASNLAPVDRARVDLVTIRIAQMLRLKVCAAIAELVDMAAEGELLITGTSVKGTENLNHRTCAFAVNPYYPVVLPVAILYLLAVPNIGRCCN